MNPMTYEVEETEGEKMVDLSELENFSFQPNWSKPKIKHFYTEKSRNQPKNSRNRNFSQTNNKNDNRAFIHKRKETKDGDEKFIKRREFRKNSDRPVFVPIVEAEFYPNDSVYEAIASALKATHKTYELFNAARLFLEKPERFVMIIKKTVNSNDKDLYLCKEDDFVFETENEAVSHAFETYVSKYFDMEEREIPQPTGHFICIHKCGITGRILCPPNYHKYHELLTEHHEKFLPKMSFGRFKSQIETITDQQEIENWKIINSKIQIYIPKHESNVEEKISLNSEAEAKKYFLDHFKNSLITRLNSVRLTGEVFSKMPRNLLSKSIFVLVEREKKFPLKFANNLRGRLRRSGFTIYKTGRHPGKSYLSGIKRKFRIAGDIFADDIQKIISCIDQHPGISFASLRLQCLNIQPESTIAEHGISSKLNNSEQSTKCIDNDEIKPSSLYENDKEDGNADSLANFLKNLHWLIREGYVAEFEDGTLISTEIMPAKKNIHKNEASEGQQSSDFSKVDLQEANQNQSEEVVAEF